MKKLFCLFCLLFICFGCGKNEVEESEPTPPIEPEIPYDYAEFGGYQVKDTAGFQNGTIRYSSSNDTTWLFGIKNEKPWFGLFNAKTKVQLSEWLCKTPFLTNTQCTIPFIPFTISDGFVFFIEYPTGDADFSAFVPFLLREDKATFLETYDKIAWGNDKKFRVQELADNIFIYHPYYKGYIYSKAGTELVNSVTISDKREDGKYFLSGFKQKKVWFGAYEDDKPIQEYVGSQDYDRNIKIHQGYGEYEDYYVDELPFGDLLETNWGYAFAPRLRYKMDGHIHDIFLCEKGVIRRIEPSSYFFTMHNWYNNSLLVYDSSILYRIYSSQGELILQQSKQMDGYADPFQNGNKYPISFSEYIRCDFWGLGNGRASLNIERYNLNSSAREPIWERVVGNISDRAKVTWTLLDNQSDTWSYQIDVLNYDGSKEEIRFKVNVNTGNIIKE